MSKKWGVPVVRQMSKKGVLNKWDVHQMKPWITGISSSFTYNAPVLDKLPITGTHWKTGTLGG